MNENEILYDALNAVYGNLPDVGVPHYEAIMLVFFFLVIFGWMYIILLRHSDDYMTTNKFLRIFYSPWTSGVVLVFFMVSLIGGLKLKEINHEKKEKQFVEFLMQDPETHEKIVQLREMVRSFNEMKKGK